MKGFGSVNVFEDTLIRLIFKNKEEMDKFLDRCATVEKRFIEIFLVTGALS